MALHYDKEVRIFKVSRMGPIDNNGYIIVSPTTNDAVIVDAPEEPEKLLYDLKISGANVNAIVITHSHNDHVAGIEILRSKLAVPVWAHIDDAGDISVVDEVFEGDDNMDIGDINMKVIHTPGHTPGSTCYLVDGHLFSGDTLFPGGPGFTATPDDLRQEITSICSKLFVISRETNVYPGHGQDVTVGQANDEYAIFSSKSHSTTLCGNVSWLTG